MTELVQGRYGNCWFAHDTSRVFQSADAANAYAAAEKASGNSVFANYEPANLGGAGSETPTPTNPTPTNPTPTNPTPTNPTPTNPTPTNPTPTNPTPTNPTPTPEQTANQQRYNEALEKHRAAYETQKLKLNEMRELDNTIKKNRMELSTVTNNLKNAQIAFEGVEVGTPEYTAKAKALLNNMAEVDKLSAENKALLEKYVKLSDEVATGTQKLKNLQSEIHTALKPTREPLLEARKLPGVDPKAAPKPAKATGNWFSKAGSWLKGKRGKLALIGLGIAALGAGIAWGYSAYVSKDKASTVTDEAEETAEVTEQALADAKAEAETAKAELETAKAEVETAKAQAEAAKAEAETAKAQAEAAKAEAETAKAQAEAAKAEAETAKAQAEAAKAADSQGIQGGQGNQTGQGSQTEQGTQTGQGNPTGQRTQAGQGGFGTVTGDRQGGQNAQVITEYEAPVYTSNPFATVTNEDGLSIAQMKGEIAVNKEENRQLRQDIKEARREHRKYGDATHPSVADMRSDIKENRQANRELRQDIREARREARQQRRAERKAS